MQAKCVRPEIGVAIVFLAVAGLLGCGNGRVPTYPAGGRVVFADGAPLQGGSIEFAPKEGAIKTSARAMIENDGTFRLSTYGNGDGAHAGVYRVSILPARHRGERGTTPPRGMSGKYQDPNTSGLEATVSADSPNKFELVVEPSS
jgi:hypothetical protein